MANAPRMSRDEFFSLLEDLVMTNVGHNFSVEIGGEGKVVVLRWAVTGSAERTEKKALFFSRSPVMLNAALEAFTVWEKEIQGELYMQYADHSDPDAAYERHLENAGWQDADAQDRWEAEHGCLDYWQSKALAEGKSLREIEDATAPVLEVAADWQTRARGTNDQEYQIYVANAEALGWKVKSFDEWVRS